MRKTHYEMMTSDLMPITALFEPLKAELPTEGFTWEQFLNTKIMQEHISFAPLYGTQHVLVSAQILFHVYSYYIGSGRTYKICDDIAELLLNTRLNVDSNLVKSPFTEIQIVLPDNHSLLYVYNEQTGIHLADCIYVNFNETEYDKMIRILLTGRPNEKSRDQYDDAVFHFRVLLQPGKVEKSIKTCLEEWTNDPVYGSSLTPEIEEMLQRTFHFVLNVLLYLTSQDADIVREISEGERLAEKKKGLKSAGKIRKIERKLENLSQIPVYYIGKSVKLSPEEKALCTEIKKRSKHMIRYPVGGHWRMQWCGPRKASYQKQVWVRPHFRGPEFAEIIKSIGVIS